jgi:hypothetical protein
MSCSNRESSTPHSAPETQSVLSSAMIVSIRWRPLTEGSTVSATDNPQGDQSERSPANIDAKTAINASEFTSSEALLPSVLSVLWWSFVSRSWLSALLAHDLLPPHPQS